MGIIALEGVTKVFPNGVKATDNVTLKVADGEFLVLVGPSGCGKSTLLRMIAGLEDLTSGSIAIGERDVTRLPARDRDIAMVFQNYALYPHMSVRGNLGFGLKLKKVPKGEIDRRVNAVAQTLALDTLLDRKPAALSGGQRQRVAMGRAMVREPTAFLMDEPLSNLDAKLRVTMRAELARLHERLGVTTVYVTHDQVEAMTLGDRVAVMRGGVLQQCDTPSALFRNPVNVFVASFIGSPSMNLVEAEIVDGVVRFAEHALPLPVTSRLPRRLERVVIGIRPTSFHVDNGELGDDIPRMRVRIDVIEELGAEQLVVFHVAAPAVDADVIGSTADTATGDGRLLADDGTLFTARVDSRHQLQHGTTVDLIVSTEEIYAFDHGTWLAIDGRPVAAPPATEDANTHSAKLGEASYLVDGGA